LFEPGFRASLPLAAARAAARAAAFPSGAGGDPARALAAAERRTTLPMLLRVEDRVTMALGLESRPVPCLHRVPGVASRLPGDLLVGPDGEGKRALREAARGLVPEAVRTRREKRGFPTPFLRAARGEGRDLAEALLTDRRARERGWWDVAACRRLLDAARDEAPRPAHDRSLFAVLLLETWARAFLDGRPQPSGTAGEARLAATGSGR
jgi:asparagine synthase (glutamine-hydrolysing)